MKPTSPHPFFQTQWNENVQHVDDCSATCPCSRVSGFCGARIQPECLRIGADSTVRVGLSVPAKVWFALLPELGETLELTRNPVAVLGRLGTMPTLDDWRNPVLPRASHGLFAPNLAEYGRLWAVREWTSGGLVHGLESQDLSGLSFQRVLLARDAHRYRFEEFVTRYQSSPQEAAVWFPPNHTSSAQRQSTLAGRIPWLRARLTSGAADVRRLQRNSVSHLLASAGKAKLPLRTLLYGRALINGAIWTPASAEAEATPAHGAIRFFYGDEVGLHVNLAAVASVWLWMGPCPCCAEQRWSVEVADAHDCIRLAVMSGEESQEQTWRELLNACRA